MISADSFFKSVEKKRRTHLGDRRFSPQVIVHPHDIVPNERSVIKINKKKKQTIETSSLFEHGLDFLSRANGATRTISVKNGEELLVDQRIANLSIVNVALGRAAKHETTLQKADLFLANEQNKKRGDR